MEICVLMFLYKLIVINIEEQLLQKNVPVLIIFVWEGQNR